MSAPDLLADLLSSYAGDARWFAILHLAIVFFVGRTYLRLRREMRALNEWMPGEHGSGAASVLAAFVDDCARLGPHGFVVPITDYSDRLDAQVHNIVDEINERTSMLLIVGIAGTIFGVFEFASRVTRITSGDRLAEIAAILAESIAKAFPVGFIGLFLMMTFQLALALPIAHLEEAARLSTSRALQFRGAISRTVADSIADSIGESMKPVATLGITVSEHLQPVVTTLAHGLEQSLSLVKVQFGEIDRSTERFTKASADLQTSSSALTETAANLAGLLRSTPAVLTKTEELQELQRAALQKISTAFEGNLRVAESVAQSLHSVRSSVDDLPDHLVQKTADALRGAFDQVLAESAHTWSDLTRRLTTSLQEDYVEFVGRTKTEIGHVHEEIRAAANEWHRLAGESRALISEPLSKAFESVTSGSDRVLATTVSLAESLQLVQTSVRSLPDELLRQTAAAVEPAFERIASQAVGTWSELVRSVAVDLQRDYTQYVASAREEVARTNDQLGAAALELRRVAEQTQAFLTEPMKTAIETARVEATGLLAAVDEFVRDRYPALKNDMEQFSAQIRASADAFAAMEKRLRGLEVQQRPDPVMVQILGEIRDRLSTQDVRASRSRLQREEKEPENVEATKVAKFDNVKTERTEGRRSVLVTFLDRLFPPDWFQRK